MKQNKNFAASLIASVASFMLMPVALFWFANVLDMFKGGDASFVTVLLFVVLFVVVGVLATEIVYAIKARKGNEVSKVFNIITMVLNAVFAVLCLLISILMFVEIGAMAFEEFLFYCPYYFVFLWGAASFGTAFGFRLYAMLKK